MATKTYYGEFTVDESGIVIHFRLHVPSELLHQSEVANPSNLTFSGRDKQFIAWDAPNFRSLGGGTSATCGFRLMPDPEPLRLYTREILVREKGGKVEFAEGSRFLSTGKSWFATGLANMFVQ